MAKWWEDCLNEGLGEIARPVKMPVTHSRTKRPREALLQLDIGIELNMFSIGGSLRAPVRYHPCLFLCLIFLHESGEEDSVWWVVYLGRMPPKM